MEHQREMIGLLSKIQEESVSLPGKRDGYFTNLSSQREREKGEFTNLETDNVITADAAFPQGEQIAVSIETVSREEAQKGICFFATSFHRHDFFEMIYVAQGHCTTTIEGREVTLLEGNLCIYHLETVHQLKVEDTQSIVVNILIRKELFDRTFWELCDRAEGVSGFFIRALYRIPSPSGHLVFSMEEDEDGKFYLEKIITEALKRETLYENLLYSNLASLFTLLSRRYRASVDKIVIDSHQSDIGEIIAYISSHYQNLTLEKLSRRFHYSPRTMIRLIRRATYRNFHEILTEFRMTEAGRLLEKGEKSVAQIAALVGYQDRSYFDKAFRGYFGQTPAQYRKEKLRPGSFPAYGTGPRVLFFGGIPEEPPRRRPRTE